MVVHRDRDRAKLLGLHVHLHTCVRHLHPLRFPLLHLHVIRPTPRSGMEVEGKEEEKTPGKNRGRWSKPVEQV